MPGHYFCGQKFSACQVSGFWFNHLTQLKSPFLKNDSLCSVLHKKLSLKMLNSCLVGKFLNFNRNLSYFSWQYKIISSFCFKGSNYKMFCFKNNEVEKTMSFDKISKLNDKIYSTKLQRYEMAGDSKIFLYLVCCSLSLI